MRPASLAVEHPTTRALGRQVEVGAIGAEVLGDRVRLDPVEGPHHGAGRGVEPDECMGLRPRHVEEVTAGENGGSTLGHEKGSHHAVRRGGPWCERSCGRGRGEVATRLTVDRDEVTTEIDRGPGGRQSPNRRAWPAGGARAHGTGGDVDGRDLVPARGAPHGVEETTDVERAPVGGDRHRPDGGAARAPGERRRAG